VLLLYCLSMSLCEQFCVGNIPITILGRQLFQIFSVSPPVMAENILRYRSFSLYVKLAVRQPGTGTLTKHYGYMQELGYTFEQIETQVGRGIEGKLLQPSSEAPGSRSLRVTAAGIYMHKRMLNYFTYIDAIVVDTPIVDPAVRFQIADVHTIHERLERGAIFRAYLDEQWKFEADSTTFSWPLASAALERDMRRIKARAESGSSGGKPGGRGPARRDAGL